MTSPFAVCGIACKNPHHAFLCCRCGLEIKKVPDPSLRSVFSCPVCLSKNEVSYMVSLYTMSGTNEQENRRIRQVLGELKTKKTMIREYLKEKP